MKIIRYTLTSGNARCDVCMLPLADDDGNPHLRLNAKSLSSGEYRLLGQIVATMVAQRGPMPTIFDRSSVNYMMALHDDAEISVDDLPPEQKRIVDEVCYACFLFDLVF